MIHAYDSIYLVDAMANLGEAFDVAVNHCNIDIDDYLDMWVVSGYAAQFEKGVPKYVVGMSGTEMVCETISTSGLKLKLPEIYVEYECTPEYWCGWALAYYQWYMGCGFKYIHQYITMKEILRMYDTLHEASEEKLVDVMNGMINKQEEITKLQYYRRMMGYTQKLLAEKSGVTLRMIQQYEQRAKDISKASAANVLSLAKVLGCSVEELIYENKIESI